MSLHEPAWRIPSRPCPFYQKGNCIFAARCNFLHVVQEKGGVYQNSTILSRLSEDAMYSPQVKTPILRVESPVLSARSPPMQRLISALTDVIGDDSQDEEEAYTDSITCVEPDPASTWSEALPTLVHGADTTFFARVTDTMAEMMRITDGGDLDDDEEDTKSSRASLQIHTSGADDTLRRPSFLDTPLIHTTHSSPGEQYIEMPQIPDNHNDLLSPVDLSHLNLHNFHLDDIPDNSSLDSAFAEPFRIPKSPARSSTFELLHSPFGSPSARVLSPRVASFIGRSPPSLPSFPLNEEQHHDLESDLDSPSDRIFTSVVPDDPDDISDDDQPPSTEAGDVSQDTIYAVDDISTEEDSNSEDDLLPEGDDGSYGHTSVWDPAGAETAVFIGSRSPLAAEVEAELVRQSERVLSEHDFEADTPVWNDVDVETSANEISISSEVFSDEMQVVYPSLLEEAEEIADAEDSPIEQERTVSPQDESFVDAPASSQVSLCPPFLEETEEITSMENLPLESETVFSPPAKENQFVEHPTRSKVPFESPLDDNDAVGDQLDSDMTTKSEDDSTAYLAYLQNERSDSQEGDTLHSLYDVYGSEMAPSPKSFSSFAESPLSVGPLRERVFTPPPPSASRAGYAYNHSTPPSSPIASLKSASKGRASPASIASSSKRSIKNSNEDEQSKKVPFGFRSSRSHSQRHSIRPSLVLNQGRSLSRLSSYPSAGPDDGLDQSATTPPSSASSTGPLRPLRLSVLINSRSNSRLSHSSSNLSLSHANIYSDSGRASLSSVPYRNSLAVSRSLSSAPATTSSYHPSNTIDSRPKRSPSLLTDDLSHLTTFPSPISAPVAASSSWPSAPPPHAMQSGQLRPSSRLSDPIYEQDGEEDATYRPDNQDEFIRRPIQPTPRNAPILTPNPVLREPMHSIATPKPTLMFAIASNDVEQVRRVLENGDANPNDTVGPQSALQFALTNDQLTNKLEIVKTLLAFGADPSQVTTSGNKKQEQEQPSSSSRGEDGEGRSAERQPHQMSSALMDEMDPATRYYVQRADAAHTRKTSALIQRSFFRPLTRVRYDLVGQDRALEELFKLLSIHSRQISVSPLVVMFSGPSGHGKSLLARKFGSLLDVPTHTVNMVTVRSQDSLWESYSLNPHEEPTNCTLSEFLVNNEGKRCVVVLDEIEKVDNEKVLWSLLMPWEHGRCSFEAKSRHVDVRNVIWLCTSNIGHDLVFDHWTARENPQEMLSRQEFLELVALLRPRVSERLGASVLSRITSVLPFVPFTLEEKRAVCAEAIYQMGGEDATALSMEAIESLIRIALKHYIPEEGSRSLHRAVSNQLAELI